MSENQRVEWKESWRDEYLRWVCGFANADGGGKEVIHHEAHEGHEEGEEATRRG
ncbi:MAG TPA: hypothetical protein P5318_12250 [Candidatus Hydrogenedentes bacterium]|nr:hypothetical protein [Candidatus Hydrogenedentota bacterium]HRT20890.1 hypothetical protein [Candidatus Hydrogenedentota bacterium]HRT66232.1 hypothetical protein [Candidatus Hydrogenedentota bacterium]